MREFFKRYFGIKMPSKVLARDIGQFITKEPTRYIDGLKLLKELKKWQNGIDDTHYCPIVEEHTLDSVIYMVECAMGIQ